jgi:Rps23 Pro-64 3,4-dihydroxylase Tpa1-like proline 4-hydroxylase
MNIEKVKVNNNYAIVVDNWYNQEEYIKAFQECKFVSEYMADPEQTLSAKKDGKTLKQNKAVFIGELFRDFNRSTIGKLSYKLYQPELVNKLIDIDQVYSYLNMINQHNCLVSYYEESDYYKAHHDEAVITMVTWLYEEPKAFGGGNLILRDKDNNIVEEIECVSNRSVIFPSFMLHEVTAINMDEKDLNKNKGRFTISQFSMIEPTG